MEARTDAWTIEEEYLDHETGHHVIVYRNKVSKAKHIAQVMTKAACPHCGHVRSLDSEKNVDIERERAVILEELNLLHQAEIDYATKHRIRAQ
jgi:glutaredoxin